MPLKQTLVRLLVPLPNACLPKLVTPLPIVTPVRLEQNWDDLSPMLMTLLGIVTFVRLEHSSNASAPILMTLSGIV